MKKYYLLHAVLFVSCYCFGQTNTFPTIGNVGIGVQSPIWPLTVNGTITSGGNGDQRIHLRPDAGYSGYVYWAESGVAERGILGFSAGSGDLVYRSGSYDFSTGSERLRITYNGNLGIGTSTPKALLDVGGMIQISGQNLATPPSDLSYGLFPYGGVGLGIFSGATDASQGIGIWTNPNGVKTEVIRVLSGGNIGIGTLTPSEKLAVNGKIRAKEIKVENSNWPDFVFAGTYALPTLEETKRHIKEKGHLPGIPSAKEVKSNGVDLGDLNAKLLQKIEELTLYLIEMNNTIKTQQIEIEKLKKNK